MAGKRCSRRQIVRDLKPRHWHVCDERKTHQGEHVCWCGYVWAAARKKAVQRG